MCRNRDIAEMSPHGESKFLAAFEQQDPDPLSRMPRLFFETGLTVYWDGDGTWDAPALLQSGTLVVHCDKDLAFLHLYDGNRCVSLGDACEAASSSR